MQLMGSTRRAILFRMRLYAGAILPIILLTWTEILPSLAAVFLFPALGLLFYRESCPNCGSSLATQKGNGFVRLNPICRTCGNTIPDSPVRDK